ncbi:kinase-like domain-containing protein [Amylocystis lapponica]|nr:kinase-like domain-containing protein [Amylocystis lapponica]
MRDEPTGQNRNGSVAAVLSRDEPPTTLTNMRPKLSSIFTEEEGEQKRMSRQVDLEPEQRLSRELGTISRATSAPELEDPLHFVSPLSSFSQGDASQSGLGLSPAAMFLSSFSPTTDPLPSPDAEGEVVAGYRLGPIVGYGGFSIIRRASSAQGGAVAVKIVRRCDLSKHPDPARARKRLDRESAVWGSLSHEHILPLFSVTQTLYADFFVTLYCPAGSLFDILKRDGNPALPQDDAGMMFRQVVRGLRYLHEAAGYVHGDVKLENVLVDEMGVCRITDFGMASRIGERDEACASSGEEDAREPAAAQRLLPTPQPAPTRRSLSKQTGLPTHLSLSRHYGGPRHRNSSPFPASSMSTAAPPTRRFQSGSLPYASPELLLPSSSPPMSPILRRTSGR